MTKEKTDKLANLLLSADEKVVLKPLRGLRKTGSVEILPTVVRLLATSPSPKTEIEIISILGQLKGAEIPDIIAKELADNRNQEILPQLLASCWNSGLDYGKHLPLFITIFIESPFLTAFEAYTVIDNTDNFLFSKSDITASSEILRKHYTSAEEDKKALFQSLILILEDKFSTK